MRKAKATATPMEPAHLEWCRRNFALMAEGCTWGVPRSGLVFCRRGNQLVLVDRLPYQPDMPCTARQWAGYQEYDLQEHRRHFEAIGVRVIDETTPTRH